MGVLHVGDKLYRRDGEKIMTYYIVAYNKDVYPVELYLKRWDSNREIVCPVTAIGKLLFKKPEDVPKCKYKRKPKVKYVLELEDERDFKSKRYNRLKRDFSEKYYEHTPLQKEDDWSKWDYKVPEKKK